MDQNDAEDVTQEILLKLLTKLATFDRKKASFRTWLYRIVANHVINMKKRKRDQKFVSFEVCQSAMMQMPDETIEASPETSLLVEEIKIKCLTGILLCLNRSHRLIFIMSEIFDINSAEGSEIMEMSYGNYRKVLSRARKKVFNFINQNCGLVHPNNPCRCRKQLKGLIRLGFIDPDHLVFYNDKLKTIEESLYRNKEEIEYIYDTEQVRVRSLFKNHPFYNPLDFEKQIGKFLSVNLQKLIRS
jgi:RNA polymerase sigma factor (sigma-70 family)